MIHKTPKWFLNAEPHEVQQIYHIWKDNYIKYYDVPDLRRINGFNPNNYNIECVRMDSHNSSYILTKWGYAINFTMYELSQSEPNKVYGKNDGVFYPCLGNGKIVMNGMTKKTRGKNLWSYKELCNKYLLSSKETLKKVMPENNVNIFW